MQNTYIPQPFVNTSNYNTTVPTVLPYELPAYSSNVSCRSLNSEQYGNVFSSKYIPFPNNASLLDTNHLTNSWLFSNTSNYSGNTGANSVGNSFASVENNSVPVSSGTSEDKYKFCASHFGYNYNRAYSNESSNISPASQFMSSESNCFPLNMSQDNNAHSSFPVSGLHTAVSPNSENTEAFRLSKPDLNNETVASEMKSTNSVSKGRKIPDTSSLDSHTKRVFIWDLDETIIIFQSLLNGTYARKYNKNMKDLETLGLKIEDMVFRFADTFFFFNELAECAPQIHIDDVLSYDDGRDLSAYDFTTDEFSLSMKQSSQLRNDPFQNAEWKKQLAFRYRKIQDIYNSYSCYIEGLLGSNKTDWIRLRVEIENATDNWLSEAMKCLMSVHSRPGYINVLVTNTNLVAACAKLMLFGLSEFFPLNNIYSAADVGKENCFNRIVPRFGEKCTFVAVGDGEEEEKVARELNFPFWNISNHNDMILLHKALNLGYL